MPRFRAISLVALVAVALAGCGGGSSGNNNSDTSTSSTNAMHASGAAGAKLSSRKISGTGTVLVDGNGRTLYALTGTGTKNLPCSTGCSNTWFVVLSSGSKAAAGAGVTSALIGTMSADGVTYLTYNGYKLYEYSGDSAPGDTNGDGQLGDGGTWYPISAAGKPLSNGGAYGY